jgi:hypothetical protein
MFFSALALSLAGLAASSPLSLQTRDSVPCGNVLIVAIRDSGEAPGFGSLAAMVNRTLEISLDPVAIALDYPASDVASEYDASVAAGAAELGTVIQEGIDQCFELMALVGVGQGAQVISDWIAGGVGIPPASDPDGRINSFSQFIWPHLSHYLVGACKD